MTVYVVFYRPFNHENAVRGIFSSRGDALKYRDKYPDWFNFSITSYTLDELVDKND